MLVLVVVLQFLTQLFVTRNSGFFLMFFAPLILLMTQLSNPVDPVLLLVDRALETGGGSVIGMEVAAAVALARVTSPRRTVGPTDRRERMLA